LFNFRFLHYFAFFLFFIFCFGIISSAFNVTPLPSSNNQPLGKSVPSLSGPSLVLNNDSFISFTPKSTLFNFLDSDDISKNQNSSVLSKRGLNPVNFKIASGSGEDYPPPAIGNWIVDSDTYIEDETIVLNGILIVQNSGNLTLRNVTLHLNCSYDGQYYIEVDGGIFSVTDNSSISTLNSSNSWHLKAHMGSKIQLINSTLSYAGHSGWQESGIYLNANNSLILNCSIQNNYVGIWLHQAYNNTVEGNHILNSTSTMANIRLTDSDNNSLEMNEIAFGNFDGIHLDDSCDNNSISFNHIFNNSRNAIWITSLLSSSSDNIISNNSIHDNGNRGIEIQSHYNTVIFNEIFNNSHIGILLFGNNNSFFANLIYNNSNEGFFIGVDSTNNHLEENKIHHNLADGIQMEDCSNNSVLNNTIFNNTDVGILLHSSHFCDIVHNKIFNNDYSGIRLWDSINNSISFNRIYNITGTYAFSLESSSNNNIAFNNTLYNNTGIGVGVRTSSNNTVFNNTILNNGDYGVSIEINANNNNFLVNVICNNSLDGVRFYSSSNNNIFENNELSYNSGKGFYFQSSSDNNILYNIIVNNSLGFTFDSSSNNNNVMWNEFSNNSDSIQAYDDGANNNVRYNFWNDWTNPDINGDGIVDNPYSIEGTANNKDYYPLVYPYQNHDPIFIDENSDFVNLGFPGEGTPINPYIIEGYNFTSLTTHLINIQDVDVYFIIQVNLFNGLDSGYNAINLQNVTNCVITNNKITRSENGVELDDCNQNWILNNTISNNSNYGIYLHSDSNSNIIDWNTICENHEAIMMFECHNNTLSYNNMSNNSIRGIRFMSSHNITVSTNIISYNNFGGIVIGNSRNASIKNNIIYNHTENGILLQASNISTILNNTLYNIENGAIILAQYSYNNIVNYNLIFNNTKGIDIDVYSDYNLVFNNSIYNNSHSAIWIHSFCDENEIYNNTIYQNYDYGIFLYDRSSHNIISSNRIYDNVDSGIYLADGHYNNTITHNIIYNNYYGIELFLNNTNNDISYNTIFDNNQYGIFIQSSSGYNSIYLNNIKTNLLDQVIDNNGTNIFVQNGLGNHWGIAYTGSDIDNDGIGDTPYLIGGSAGNQDFFPLIYFAERYQSIEGDWNVTEIEFRENKYIFLEGNLLIQSGGLLTLQNTTLRINCSSDGQYRIEVYNGGSLIIEANSSVSSINPLFSWFLKANVGSFTVFKNSMFSYAGYALGTNKEHTGIWINSNNTQIVNCTIFGNYYGVCLYRSNESIIEGNNIVNSSYIGLSIYNGTNNILDRNYIINNSKGIFLFSSIFNNISENEVSHNIYEGVLLYSNANYNLITRNHIYENAFEGIKLESSSNNIISHNSINNNSHEGILIFSSSNSNLIFNNTISNNSLEGIRLFSSANQNNLSNNLISNNKFEGIRLHSCSKTLITNNTIYNNEIKGIFLYEFAFNNTLIYNTIENTQGDGLHITSSAGQNWIYLNNLKDNVVDNNGSNTFYNNGMGNFWDTMYMGLDINEDGIGEISYVIQGTPGNIDPYPLIYSAEWYFSFDITTISGDWVVTDLETHHDEIITLNGNLLIQSGGNLTLQNVILRLNCSSNGEYRVEIYNGGSLTIKSKSVVTALNISDVWYLKANSGSTILFENSTFNYAGWEYGSNGDHTGLWINTNDAQILNNTIYNNYMGIYLSYSNYGKINNVKVYNTTKEVIHLAYSSHNSINNCSIGNNQDQGGIYMDFSHNNSIFNNIIANNDEVGIYLYSCSKNNILNNSIYNNMMGIKVSSSNNNTIFNNILYNNSQDGIEIEASSQYNIISNNSIYNNSYSGIVAYTSCNKNVISNNTIYKNTFDGIRVFSFFNNTIIGNKIYKNNDNGINLDTSNNNIIIDNTIFENGNYGISMGTQTADNIIANNTIFNSQWGGIRVENVNSYRNIFANNTIYNITQVGLWIIQSNNTAINNTIFDCDTGIYLDNVAFCNISFNRIYNNVENGVLLGYAYNNTLLNNFLYNNGQDGISAHDSLNNTFSQNTLYNNSQSGIYLYHSSDNNTIANNSIVMNRNYGVHIDSYYGITINNIVQWNDFINNNESGGSQAFDDNPVNTFENNYWNEWVSPDGDKNGIVDDPYTIAGAANNKDFTPQTTPNNPSEIHYLAQPTILFPSSDDFLAGTVTIQWTNAYDSYNHEVTYTVSYSPDNGSNWFIITSNIASNTSEWDTTVVADGSLYLIRINASCSEGLWIIGAMEQPFIVDNTPPTTPVIIGILEISDHLYYNGSSFIYSNDQPMSDSFTIQLITGDILSGLKNATGSSEFGGETPVDTTYSGMYELTYTISQLETAGGDDQVIVTVYDNAGNGVNISISCILDNTPPIPSIIDLIENSEYLHYSTPNFYYSNDQPMSESFSVNVTCTDALSGRQKANATEFGANFSTNDYTSGYYILTFTVDQGETAPSFNIEVWDNVGNPASVSLSTILDNTPPTVLISSPSNTTYIASMVTITLVGDADTYQYYIVGVDTSNITWTSTTERALVSGTYTLNAYGRDLVSNINQTSVYFTVDTPGPDIMIDSPTNTTYATNTVSINFTGDAIHYWYYIAGVDSTNQSWTGSTDRTLSDGFYTLYAYGNDSGGFETYVRVSFTLDTTPPSISIVSPINMIYTSGTITIDLSGDAIHFWYYIAGVDSTNQSWTGSTDRTLPDASYTLHAYGNDSVGNIRHIMVDFSIDTIAPVVNIDSPLPLSYGSDTINVSLSGDAIHYWYYIDSIDSQNLSWTGSVDRTLLDNTFTLHAYGNDTAGNIGYNSVTFSIDTEAPLIIINSPLSVFYLTNAINVSLSGEAIHYWYYIEPIDSQNLTWGATIERTLADNSYTLYAFGNDSAGNIGSSSVSFTIDTVFPSINIDSPLMETYNDTITITLSGDAIHYWYFIEGIDGQNQSWLSSVQRTLPNGSFTLHAYGNDTAGNIGYSFVSFNIDITPPQILILSPLAQTYGVSTITISLSGDAQYYWYYIEGIDSQNQTWITSVQRSLINGSYTLHAYGNDTVGNIGFSSVNFVIDTSFPLIMIESPQMVSYRTNTFSVNLSGNALFYWYFIEGIDTMNISWTENVGRTLPDGTYTLHAYGNNTIGKTAHTFVIFTLDTTPPIVTIDSPSSIIYSSSNITITLSGDAENYWYFIDPLDVHNHTWTNSINRTLTNGLYTLFAYGNDTLGNIGVNNVVFSIEIQLLFVKVDSPTSTFYDTEKVTISLSGNGDHYWYYIENVDGQNITWTRDVNRTLEDGSYVLHAYTNNTEGDIGQSHVNFTIDTIVPIVTINSPLNQIYGSTSVQITLSGDAIHFWYYIAPSDSHNQTWSDNVTRTLQEGSYTLYAFGNDSAGNIGTDSLEFSVDISPPDLVIESPLGQVYRDETVNVTFSGSADHYWYCIKPIDSQNHTWTTSAFRTLTNGMYTLHAYGNDSVGNLAYVTVLFEIDTSVKYVQHAPFIIISNEDFNTQGFPGEGTQENPYIIEGYNITSSESNLFYFQDTTAYFVIRNNYLNATNEIYNGIHLSNVQHGVIQENYVYRSKNGIYLNSANDVEIGNNTLQDNLMNGIFIQNSDSINITHNTILNNSGNGILITGAESATIFYNEIHRNNENGTYIVNSIYTRMKENNVHQNGKEGISIFQSPSIIYGISSFTLHQKRIEQGFLNETIIDFNTIRDNIGNGLSIYESINLLVSDNVIHHNTKAGILLMNVEDSIFVNNEIYENGEESNNPKPSYPIKLSLESTQSINGDGLVLIDSSSNLFHYNEISDNTGQGIFCQDSDSNIFSQNSVYSNIANGIYLQDSNYNRITFCDIFSNGIHGTGIYEGNGIYLDPSSHNEIVNNTIHENAANGICLYLVDQSLITNNSISENGVSGIYLQNSDYNIVTNNTIQEISSSHFTMNWHLHSIQSGVQAIGYGIYIDHSNNNNFTMNNIQNTSHYGFYISQDCIANSVEWNNFIGNYPEGTSQAYDDGSGNIFSYNYWSDHQNEDRNGDGIADSPYSIDGSAANRDYLPLNSPVTRVGYLRTVPKIEEQSQELLIIIVGVAVLGLVGITILVTRRLQKSRVSKKRRPQIELDLLFKDGFDLER
jgi:parallel beta-helix repeat protein